MAAGEDALQFLLHYGDVPVTIEYLVGIECVAVVTLIEKVNVMQADDLSGGFQFFVPNTRQVLSSDLLVREIQVVVSFGERGILVTAFAVRDDDEIHDAVKIVRNFVDASCIRAFVVRVSVNDEDARAALAEDGRAIKNHDGGENEAKSSFHVAVATIFGF
jgi:hypothetical protein